MQETAFRGFGGFHRGFGGRRLTGAVAIIGGTVAAAARANDSVACCERRFRF